MFGLWLTYVIGSARILNTFYRRLYIDVQCFRYPWFQASASKQMRSELFWDFRQRRMVIPYRRFGTTYQTRIQAFLGVLTLEDGTDILSRNVGKKLPLYAA
jgi:hypothetical protein